MQRYVCFTRTYLQPDENSASVSLNVPKYNIVNIKLVNFQYAKAIPVTGCGGP
jgi:hypothetical protein